MIIEPRMRGFICLTAHPKGCEQNVKNQIEYVKSLDLDFVYLGYWVPHAEKMNYKSQYAPFELLLDGQWRRINRHLEAKEIQELGDMLMTTLPSEWNEPIIK